LGAPPAHAGNVFCTHWADGRRFTRLVKSQLSTQSHRPADFQRALNALLPPTIRIVGAAEVGPDFNARWSAEARLPLSLVSRESRAAMIWRYVLHYPFPLDEDAMRDGQRGSIARTTLPHLQLQPAPKRTTKRGTPSGNFSTELARTLDNEELVFTVVPLVLRTWCARW